MKSLVIYYSYSGNTQKVADVLNSMLAQKGEARIQRLLPADESDKFFAQCVRAFKHIRAVLPDEKFDLSEYDLICVGTPVWAFAPVPAINTFLDKCSGLNGKKVICFTTYGSGTGVKRCLAAIEKALKEKGVSGFYNFNIQQGKAADKDFVENTISKALQDALADKA